MSKAAKRNPFRLLIAAALMFLMTGCTVQYSTSGASISPEVKTVSVAFFENYAPIVEPGFSQNFTEALRDKFINQTNLELVGSGGDLHFQGKITGYKSESQALSGDQQAITNRLTVTVQASFNNAIQPDNSYEKSFSRYADYDSNQNLSDVKAELHEDIIDQLVQDIFNAAVVNW